MVPEGLCATGKCKASSITSGYLVKRGRQSELNFFACYKQALASVLQLVMWTTPVPSSSTLRWFAELLHTARASYMWLGGYTRQGQLPFAVSLHAARASYV